MCIHVEDIAITPDIEHRLHAHVCSSIRLHYLPYVGASVCVRVRVAAHEIEERAKVESGRRHMQVHAARSM